MCQQEKILDVHHPFTLRDDGSNRAVLLAQKCAEHGLMQLKVAEASPFCSFSEEYQCFQSDAGSYRKPVEGTLQWCDMGGLGRLETNCVERL